MTQSDTSDAASRTSFGGFDLGLDDDTTAPAAAPIRIRTLGVIGAGTMGSGIAALAASAGIPVVLLDIAPPQAGSGRLRSGATRSRSGAVAEGPQGEAGAVHGRPSRRAHHARATSTTTSRCSPTCDLVIEAIIEQPAPKQALYAQLEGVAQAERDRRVEHVGHPDGGADRGTRRRVPPPLPRHALLRPAALHAPARDHPGAGDGPRRDRRGARVRRAGARQGHRHVQGRAGLHREPARRVRHGAHDRSSWSASASRSTRSTRSPARSSGARSRRRSAPRDLSGVDVIGHVSAGLAQTTGEDFSLPAWVHQMIAEKQPRRQDRRRVLQARSARTS